MENSQGLNEKTFHVNLILNEGKKCEIFSKNAVFKTKLLV